METEKAINGRRSVREYQDKPIPQNITDKLLKAGAMAPSAMDSQQCRFIVITDKAKIRELSDKVKEKAGALGIGASMLEKLRVKEDVIFYNAPLLVLLAAEKNDWAPIDCSLAAQNMMLMGYDMGLGSCFIGFATMLTGDMEVMRSLGIKDSQKIYCPLVFGYPKEWPHPKSREAKIQKKI